MPFIEALESRVLFNGGQVDTTFGNNGVAQADLATALGTGWQFLAPRTFSLDSGGRIYAITAASSKVGSTSDVVVTRFSRDGQVDASFAQGGFRVLDRDPVVFHDYQPHVFVDPNSRAYVLDGPLLWRLTSSGRVDRTFGKRGKIIVPILTTNSATSVVFDAGGRAYLGGSTQGKSGTRMTIIRLTETGQHDTTWGYLGAYKSPVPTAAGAIPRSGISGVSTMRVLPNGQIAVAGVFRYSVREREMSQLSHATQGPWSTGLNADGSVDTSYGIDGYQQVTVEDSGTALASSNPLAIAPDGAVIGVTNIGTDAEDDDQASTGSNWRIAPDGKTTQTLIIAPASFDQQFSIEQIKGPIAVQADGKIVAAGPSGTLFRSAGMGALDPSFGGSGGLAQVDNETGIGADLDIQPDRSIIASEGGGATTTITLHRLFPDDAPLGQFDGRNLRLPRNAAIRFSVTWRDDDGMDVSSIDSSDFRVVGPFDGVRHSRGVSLEFVVDLADGRYLATYRVTSTGGWTAGDNGTYSVRLAADQVKDTNGDAAAATTIGSFRVRIA
jgi:uncharacterized delta-60 repeat protein